MKFAYFKQVVSTGGTEGKLVQSVFPYRYMIHDAKFFPLEALLTQPTPISPLRSHSAAQALWRQWRTYWTPRPIFLDKSPENILMSPYLQGTFGRRTSSFLFVLRHPLSWALAASKWACPWESTTNLSSFNHGFEDQPKAPPLTCIAHLTDVWLAVHKRMVRDALLLKSVTFLRSEPQNWHSVLTSVGLGASLSGETSTAWDETSHSFLRASHQYLHCWLNGAPPVRWRTDDARQAGARSREIGGIGGGGGGTCGVAFAAASRERQQWLKSFRELSLVRVRALGFSLDLRRVQEACCEAEPSDWGPPELDWTAVVQPEGPIDVSGREAATGEVGRVPSYKAHAIDASGIGLHAGRTALMLSSSFLSGFNGMQQRAAQLAVAVGKLGFGVHFVSLGELKSTEECSVAEPAVICHAAGNASEQYAGFARWAHARRSAPTLLLLGFTSLTLEASRTLLARPAATASAWKREGFGGDALLRLLAPRAARAVELFQRAMRDWPMLRAVVFTDDVHYLRTRAILVQAGVLARQTTLNGTLTALRSVEMSVYRQSRLTLTVSGADRAAVLAALTETSDGNASSNPAVLVAPFGANALADGAVTPLALRVPGRMLYVGTCHPVAKAGVAWMLREVMPSLIRRAADAKLNPSFVLVGNGWAALSSEPSFKKWVDLGVLVIRGKLGVDELRQEYENACLFVAPVRNATGIATKNFHAMGMGIPLLTTSLGIAGMRLPSSPLGLCCDVSLSETWPGECEAPPASRDDFIAPVRPTLEADCLKAPKRLECSAYRVARNKDGGTSAVRGKGSHSGASARSLLTADARRDSIRVLAPVALRATQVARGGGFASPLPASHDEVPVHAVLHPSGSVLVADSASKFASAAVASLTNDALWHRLSRGGLRQMRVLVSPARQSGVLASALKEPLLLDPPAEQACVLIIDVCAEAQRLRPKLHEVLRGLFSVRVAVHIVALPAAVPVGTETDLLGWARAQGAFTYAGGAAEQWTAILASASAPPLRFAILLHDGAPSLLRSLADEHCQVSEVGHRCIWSEGHGDVAVLEQTLQVLGHPIGDASARHSEEGEEGEVPSDGDGLGDDLQAASASGVKGSTPLARSLALLHSALDGLVGHVSQPLSSAHGSCSDSTSEAEPSVPLLHLLDCVVHAQQLPLLTIVVNTAVMSIESARAAAPSTLDTRHAIGILNAVALEHEGAILTMSSVALAASETVLRHIKTLAPRLEAEIVPDTVAGRLRWVSLLSRLLFAESDT